MGRLLPAPCKLTAQMRAVLKPHEGELAVAKKRRLARAHICPCSTPLFRLRFPEEKRQQRH